MGDNLDFYRMWVDDIGRLRSLRHQHTQFNVSLNLAGAGALGFFMKEAWEWYFTVWICIGMLVVNISWLATDKWFAHETGRKFRQLAELEKGLEHKFITQDATINWRKTHRLDWLLVVEVVLPRLFFVAFLAMAVWVCWPHAADVFALLRQMLP